MKKMIEFSILSLLLVVIVSCTDRGNNPIDTNNTSNLKNDISRPPGAGYWNTDDCDNQTWDGDLNEDCYGDPSNCVVVCAEKEELPAYVDFHNAVITGHAREFYLSGAGQEFLPLYSEPYQELISGQKDIYYVGGTGGNEYALY